MNIEFQSWKAFKGLGAPSASGSAHFDRGAHGRVLLPPVLSISLSFTRQVRGETGDKCSTVVASGSFAAGRSLPSCCPMHEAFWILRLPSEPEVLSALASVSAKAKRLFISLYSWHVDTPYTPSNTVVKAYARP